MEQQLFSATQYLTIERESNERNSYFNGKIVPLAIENRAHGLIKTNLVALCHGQLRKRPCEVYASNMRAKVRKTGLYTYPDIVVVCGKPQLEDEKTDTLLNPTVLIEVLSPATEAYDRGDKFEHYRTIASLSDYVLVTQSKILVEHYVRQANNTWLLSALNEQQQVVEIRSIECSLLLEEIYEKVNFEEVE
jgi:Uma2 family endonuclease